MDFLIYTPLYNLMVLLMDTIPGLDFGIYIILFTIIVKIALFPLAVKAIKAQQAIKRIEPLVKELQKKYKDQRELLGAEMLKLYRDNQVNPFASFGLILIQIPIIFGLYYIVLRAGLPEVDPTKLYGFVGFPNFTPSPLLFGVLDVAARSLPLALLAGVTQYIQTSIALPKVEAKPTIDSETGKPDASAMMANITNQMRYVFPVLITIIAYSLTAAVGLYFVTSNIFHIFQELYVKSRGLKDQSAVAFDI